MDARVGTGYPSHGYGQEQDPHITGYHQLGEGEEEQQHHEKKPTAVLKKVKEKAKKIKETLTKHGHDHDHGQEHEHGHNLDAEDEEMVEDPEIHGAPVYDSPAVMSGVHGQPEGLSQPGKYERSTALHDDPIMPRKKPDDSIPPPGPAYYETRDVDDPISTDPIKTDPTRKGVQEEPYGQRKVNLETPGGLEEDIGAGKGGTTVYGSNYETKVTDPTGKGAQEAGVTPILHSFDKMKIYDEPEAGRSIKQEEPRTHDTQPNFPTGTHDQFSPEEPTEPKHIETPQPNQSSYTQKVSSATSAIADKAISAKNVVASKLGYGEKDNTATRTTTEPKGDTTATATATGVGSGDKPAMGYGEKISTTLTEKLSPVYGKVAGAGAAVMSKMPGGGSGDKATAGTDVKVQQDKGTSVKGYLADKFRPGDEDKALSEVISETLHKRKEESGKGDKSMGKVTESEEVAKNLNTEHETPKEVMPDPSSVNNPGKVVVDKLKGVVGSWFGSAKSEESGHVNQQAVGSTQGTEGFPGFRGEGHGGDVKAE